jgi:predicted dehydrogenase
MQHHARSLSSRRSFLRHTGTSLAVFSVVPGSVLGLRGQASPNNKLNIGFIGVGGRGAANLQGLGRESVVALCDVDTARAGNAFQKYPAAKQFSDFRVMLDRIGKDLDVVCVSTPDHTHAVAALRAMQMGKHVYCEKPMAHSIAEVRALQGAARRHKVVTQLGNQGHSSDTIRNFCEWIWDGAIGKVHTIHAVSGAMHCRVDQLPLLTEKPPVPAGLNWDLWLGPALQRPYHPMYLPGKWRGWMPFGSGAIGDWVCHVVDPVFWALDLGAPRSIIAEAKDYDPKKHADTFPPGTVITYEFAANAKRGPVKLVWFDGKERPPRPEEMEADEQVPKIGAVVIGDKGKIVYGSHGAGQHRLLPAARLEAYQRPTKTIPRVKGHHEDFLAAVRSKGKPGSNFDYGGPLTELALLGIIATRLLGQKLEWDGPAMRFTNNTNANQLLNPPSRKDWDWKKLVT